ncbi:MAG: 2-hydroxyacid dehydrogenase [Bryobacteraceae bacterium]|nr:2-hydroxyacid dehydrogenase [Bryobacteraceae bacterium]
MTRHTVFIAHDYPLEDQLDQVAQALRDQGVEVIRGPRTAPGAKLVYPPERYDELFGRAEVMMFSSRSICSRDVIRAAPRLSGIVNPTIGLETVDLAAASELGIIVGHGAQPENYLGMAEATVMFMLMLMYNPKASQEVTYGIRPRPNPREVWAQMLLGRTVGLVGLGRIAHAVVERLAGFNVKLIAYDPFVPPDSVPANVELTQDLDTLLRRSDIVGLFIAVTPETRNMINDRTLALMKPTAFLVNPSRGDAVDEDALYRALKEKRIAGAALDVFQVEPPPPDSPLLTLDNVILTPHMIGQTKDSFAAITKVAVENVRRILNREPPLYCKNPAVIPAWRERLAHMG